MDKVLILASPIAPAQQIFIYQNGVVMEKFGIALDYIADVIAAIYREYGINAVEISGNHSFTLGIQEQVTKQLLTEFELENITITCI